MAFADSRIAAFDTKYTYNVWRPITAIRAADTDGNPNTVPDPSWLSYITTPYQHGRIGRSLAPLF